jgi:hypothetical protein
LSATVAMTPPTVHGYNAFGVGPKQFSERSLPRLMWPARKPHGRKPIRR